MRGGADLSADGRIDLANITTLADDALIAFDNLADVASSLRTPTLRLGVTGLSRAGKTVFISSLIHNLTHGGRLPLFKPHAEGRIAGAALAPQPSMDVPRFQYEDHVRTLVEKREWPNSTRAIAELRLIVDYQSASAWSRTFGSGRLNIDIVDYPGEWLLDLPLLGLDFAKWSRQAIDLAETGKREKLSARWRAMLDAINPHDPVDETAVIALAEAFTDYLRACRADETSLSMLPPGRFLMPGDLEGSPALTFSPLPLTSETRPPHDSMQAVMEARYEAYKSIVVKPFFREHFARLDRQIVLVDVLQAINAGPEALKDLESALTDILACLRPGRGSILSALFGPRIERILFAATKADHLHHENHDRLEALLTRLVARAIQRAEFAGARVDVLAMAAIRATREGLARHGAENLPVIMGTPLAGETIDGETFDGETETAIFPGDLPSDPDRLLVQGGDETAPPHLRFVRFRPPKLEKTAEGVRLSLPHIRLDRALSFLLADKLA